jgi:Nitrile hydratase, alpha chain
MQREMSERRRALEQRLVEQAAKDGRFRRALLADPRGTLERELAVPLPAGVSLTVLEESPTERYLVLPPAPKGQEGALSDQELEEVAGGTCMGTSRYEEGPGSLYFVPMQTVIAACSE